MAQLSFSFQTDSKSNIYKEDDFVLLSENSSAINFLKNFFAQEKFSATKIPSIILKGPKACGKTHLLHIFAKKFHGEFIDKEKIIDVNLVSFFEENKFYILEDVSEIKDEELVLRLINSAFEAKAFLVLTTERDPQFQLKDLNSRLKNIFVAQIKSPSHEAIKQLLSNGFSRRQIKLPSKSIELISDKIERSYEAVFAAVKKVEIHCQESGKNIAMKELGAMF